MKREVKKKCVFGKCHALKSLLMGGEVEISNYIPASYVTSFLQGVGGKESNSALKGKKKTTLPAQQSGQNTKRLLDKTTWAIKVLPTIKKLQAVTTDS